MLKTKMIERKKLMILKRNGKYPYKKWKISTNIIFLLILSPTLVDCNIVF